MKRGFFILCFFFCFLVLELEAQNLSVARLDSFFTALADQNLAMGSVVISKNGKKLYSRAIGNGSVKEDRIEPATVHTHYRIGSITKMFTAVMIFQLIEERKLSLDSKLVEFFPDLPNAKLITIRNMLYHRSGLYNYSDDVGFNQSLDKPKTQEEMLAIIAAGKVAFEPNTMASYCNTNYLLLGYIVEKLRGKSYGRILNERIVSKLGLSETYFGSKIDPGKNECYAYLFLGNNWVQQPAMDISLHAGAGAIVSTPSDLSTFIQALFTFKLLKKTSVDQMTTWVDGYGMGLFPFSFEKVTGYGHGGFIEGFAPLLHYYPEQELAIAYCTNGQVYSRHEIMKEMLSILLHESHPLQLFTPIALNSEELDQYLGVYSSAQMPIKVTCTRENNSLILEAKGKLMPLEAYSPNLFRNKELGLFFEFKPSGKELLLKETDQVYYLKKED